MLRSRRAVATLAALSMLAVGAGFAPVAGAQSTSSESSASSDDKPEGDWQSSFAANPTTAAVAYYAQLSASDVLAFFWTRIATPASSEALGS